MLTLPAAAAQARVPRGFVGTVANGPLTQLSPSKLAKEFDVMARSGVESVRTDFSWAGAQPYESFASVPPAQRSRFQDIGGVPTDFSVVDRMVKLTTARGLQLLPSVNFAPPWAAEFPGQAASPPTNDAAYAEFVVALVNRYGPHGTFWKGARRRAPIRTWEIWNEPNSWAAHYAALLRVTRTALKRADPGAKMIAGGLTNVSYSYSWNALQTIYNSGGRGQFDAVAINPYTRDIGRVIKIAELVRAVMRRNGDSQVPLVITEMSWPSAKGKSSAQPDWVVTQAGEAQRVSQAYKTLAAQRGRLHLEAAYWYTWATSDTDRYDAFGYSGLRRIDRHGNVFSKPAYAAYTHIALTLEGCRSKGTMATSCNR
jgi:hypothetical protein